MESVSVVETKEFGKAVVATKDIDPGTLGVDVLREEALIIFPPRDRNVSPPWGRTKVIAESSWPDYLHFLKQRKEIQEKVLSFYVEMDCKDAWLTYKFVLPHIGSPDKAETFTRLLMVVKFNSVTLSSTAGIAGDVQYLGHGLFDTACRMAHSCRPNCIWFTTSSADGRQSTKVIRAIVPIKAGDLITVSYLDNKLLEGPTHVRQLKLKETKNFNCLCSRCSSDGDDTRLFSCHGKKCTGHHLVKQVKACDIPIFILCSACGEEAPDWFQESMLEKEADSQKNIRYVDYVADEGLQIDVTGLLKSLKPPSFFHAAALPIYHAQSELYEQMTMYPKAVDVQQHYIDCRLQLFGNEYYDEQHAFSYERLGDLTRLNNDYKGAKVAYQKAVQVLQIARGGSSEPYTKCAMNKLIAMQKRATHSSGRANYCALCGQPASKKCSGCAGTSVYCNRDHQTIHWTVHKKTCRHLK